MAFLRTVIRCSLYKKYGPVFNYINDNITKSNFNFKQICFKTTTTATTTQTSNFSSTVPASSSSSPATATAAANTSTVSPKDPLDITFEDAKAAFKSKTTYELLRAYVVYQLCSVEALVENNMKVRTNFLIIFFL